MHLRNDFDKGELQRWFAFNYTCFVCGRSNANCFHHILGRVSSSIFNASPVNNFECHIGNGKLDTKEVRLQLLKKTYDYLMDQGYKLTVKDAEFIKKNKNLYRLIL